MLTSLQALSLEHNRLKSLDEVCINALCGLTSLYLGSNELSFIGESASSLSGLTSLQTLDVSMNVLEFLPPSLSHLPSLKCLLAGYNLLETLPNSFLSTQAHLTRLELQWNRLCHCPQLTGFDEFLLDAINKKYSDDPDDLEDIDEDSPPPILSDSLSAAFTGSFSSVMISGPSAYVRAPSLFRSKSLARAPSMKRIGSRRGGPSTTLAYTPTPEPHLGVDVQSMTPCQLASSAAQKPSVIQVPHLVVLDLSSNGLLALPPWLPPSLQSLSASNNRLESVDAWLAERLTRLHSLDLQSNRITHLSRSLSQLNEIACVCLADNPCSDVDAAAGGAEMAGWLEEHVLKLKYNKKVQSELQLNRDV
jgi:Leucine-rich repeat (LRR) protein